MGYGDPLVVEKDHGFVIELRGGRFTLKHLLLFVQLVMPGAMMIAAVGWALWFAVQTLVSGEWMMAAPIGALVFAGVCGWLAWNTLDALSRVSTRVRLEASGSSLRLTRSLLGWVRAQHEISADDADRAVVDGRFWEQLLHLGEVTVPVLLDTDGKQELVEVLAQWAAGARAQPGEVPEPPESIRTMRQREASDVR